MNNTIIEILILLTISRNNQKHALLKAALSTQKYIIIFNLQLFYSIFFLILPLSYQSDRVLCTKQAVFMTNRKLLYIRLRREDCRKEEKLDGILCSNSHPIYKYVRTYIK